MVLAQAFALRSAEEAVFLVAVFCAICLTFGAPVVRSLDLEGQDQSLPYS